MKFVKNLKIRDKLSLLFLVLFVPLLLFVSDIMVREFNNRKELSTARINLEESGMITHLLHEIQMERGLTAGFLSSNGHAYVVRMRSQRTLTDLSIADLRDFLQANGRSIDVMPMFFDLQYYRRQIDDMTIDTEAWNLHYYAIRDALLRRISENSNRINIGDIRKQLNAHSHLAHAKQYLGQLRNVTTRLITLGKPDYQLYKLFGAYYQNYRSNIDFYARNIANEDLSLFKQVIEEDDFREVANLLNSLDLDVNLDLSHIDPVEWFNKVTSTINRLHEVETYSMDRLMGVMTSQIRNNDITLVYLLTIFVIAMALAFYLAFYIIRYILQAVLTLKRASDNLALGHPDVDARIDGKDEFGSLANSFRKLAEKNRELSRVAEAIGKGDYNVDVNIAGHADILGHAVEKMKQNLKNLSIETENRNWSLYGISVLNEQLSEAVSIQCASKIVIDHLCQYMKCDLGAIFIRENDDFEFKAGYATEFSTFEPKSFTWGEGIPGEALVQKRVLVVNDVPGHNLKIKTGLSESETFHIMVCPIYFNTEAKGLIELVSRNEFPERDIKYVEEVTRHAGIVINTIQNTIKTQELLHETQNQAEELEAQQEELRQMNEELKEQKEYLQASEEELKASQDQLQEKNKELEKRAIELEEQNRDIQSKNRELENARQAVELKVAQVESISQYKTEFLANMSHELRTPLNSILILSNLLSEETNKLGLQKQAEHAKVINTSGRDLLKLINDILDLSKIESGHIKLEFKDVTIKNLDFLADFKPVAIQKHINTGIFIGDGTPDSMVTDEFRLRQIMKNLLSNAFKFTPENGKVECRIARYDKPGKFVSDSLKNADCVIAFSVSDTGIGIPKEKFQTIFEAFQQADTSTTRKFGGTGLGLSISKELANLLGGEIHVKSKVNQGSTFTLYLPHNKASSIARPRSSFNIQLFEQHEPQSSQVSDVFGNYKPSRKIKKALIVDGDKGLNNIIAGFIIKQGIEVFQAYTGAEALGMLNKQPDAVLMDVSLPDMNGLDILKAIRGDSMLENTQVHLMTSEKEDKISESGLEFQSILPKPFSMEQIGRALANTGNDLIRKVLVVEDNKSENHAITELLASEHIQSIAAYSGIEALEAMERAESEIDAVILDLMLPDMEGFKVMEEIRTGKSKSPKPIIVYSGKDLSEKEENKLKKYANTIIIKNEYSYSRLMDEIKLFLQKVNETLSTKDKTISLHMPGRVLRGKKTLIIDDDVRNIYALYNSLESHEMKIDVANDGHEALKKLSENKDIDIILMDIMMPGMDGIECIKQIRSLPEFKNLPIIALTAKAMKGDREKCLEAGASDYISKPVDVQKLISLMRIWIYDSQIRNGY